MEDVEMNPRFFSLRIAGSVVTAVSLAGEAVVPGSRALPKPVLVGRHPAALTAGGYAPADLGSLTPILGATAPVCTGFRAHRRQELPRLTALKEDYRLIFQILPAVVKHSA
jgi:hypothetical protein